jgi:3-phosphoshikimate 1-carboxyvinyltransferase
MTDALWPAPLASGPVEARVPVPGSKSLTARWLVLAAIAQGPSVLHGALESRDTRLMREALEALGARFDRTEDALQVRPLPAPSAEPAAPITIHTGLAGTVMRFVPLVAGLHHGDVTFTGDPSALRRPMGPVLAALRGLGVEVTELGAGSRSTPPPRASSSPRCSWSPLAATRTSKWSTSAPPSPRSPTSR